MYWANFVHLYQPPTQTREIVDKVTRECYRPLVALLRDAPAARLTVNITGTLLEQLDRYGHRDVVRGLAQLAEAGSIELTGSAMFHPILPLLPRREMRRQIQLNEQACRRYLGEAFRPQGFFPPEMCYSRDVALIVRDLGYRWIVVDEVARGAESRSDGSVLERRCYALEGLGEFYVFFKERPLSAKLTYGDLPNARALMGALGPDAMREGYLLTGTDGEIYGHHRPGQELLLEQVWQQGEPATCLVSDLFRLFPARASALPLPSSWSTWPRELAAGVPYPQWDHPHNPLHKLQWELARLAMEAAEHLSESAPDRGETRALRSLTDEGLHSCQWWWASCRPWWDVGMISAGATRLREAVEAAGAIVGTRRVERACELHQQIVTLARRWQDTGEAQRRKDAYKAETPEVTNELTFGERAG